jgi:hypothetical protein
MASIQWKDADCARPIAGPILCRNSRSEEFEELAQQSVRKQQVEDDLYWVVLNLPNQTSLTLYLGSNEEEAALAVRMARGAVAHALEYALGAPGKAPGEPAVGLLGQKPMAGRTQ